MKKRDFGFNKFMCLYAIGLSLATPALAATPNEIAESTVEVKEDVLTATSEDTVESTDAVTVLETDTPSDIAVNDTSTNVDTPTDITVNNTSTNVDTPTIEEDPSNDLRIRNPFCVARAAIDAAECQTSAITISAAEILRCNQLPALQIPACLAQEAIQHAADTLACNNDYIAAVRLC